MFEIAATRFEKGTFDIQLEKKLPKPLALIARLGPYGGRLLGLALIVGASFIGISEPRLLEAHPDWNPLYIRSVQYSLAVIGLLIYSVIFFVRQAKLDLHFDRSHAELRLLLTPLFAKMPLVQGLVPFRNVKALKVVSAGSEPRTACGYLEILTEAPEKDPFRSIQFAFMTDEQKQFFPKNLSQLVGVEPTGDWQDL